MKYMRQFGIIMLVTCIGEILKYLIPLAIPSSIYGLCLMMVLLVTGIVKVDDVKLKTMLVPLIIITFVSTVLVMAVSGKVTQYVINRRKKHESDDN